MFVFFLLLKKGSILENLGFRYDDSNFNYELNPNEKLQICTILLIFIQCVYFYDLEVYPEIVYEKFSSECSKI